MLSQNRPIPYYCDKLRFAWAWLRTIYNHVLFEVNDAQEWHKEYYNKTRGYTLNIVRSFDVEYLLLAIL